MPQAHLITAGDPTENWRVTITVALLLALLCLSSAADANHAALKREGRFEITIGLRAYQGNEQAMRQWGPTADYLTEQIPGYRFHMVPYENNISLNEAVSRNSFDFVLTQPASYVEYEMRYGAQRLVTLINKRQGKGYSQFGSVIFTRAARTDINTLGDLKGKVFMGAAELGFGGWLVACRELRNKGIDPYKDLKALIWGGGIQQNVVDAVLKGTADAGTVRTDLLERLSATGKLDLSAIKVINPQHVNGFPFMLSSRLYPEWPLAKLAHTDDELAEQVARALLAISPFDAAAQAGNYVGWHTPLDYQTVHDLLKELNTGPYAMHDITVDKVAEQYWHWILATAVAMLLGFAVIARMQRLNRRLREAESQLQDSNRRLQDMARLDGLTGLGNRHRLEEFLQQEWGQACRKGRGIAILLFDIDYFKQYNDTYGHMAGDVCLKKIARVTAGLFRRAGELVVRYGGEEFMVVLTEYQQGEAEALAQELRKRVQQLQIPHSGSTVSGHVTISIGVAGCVPEKAARPQDLIAAADSSLYAAKDAGRNRVVCHRGCEANPASVESIR